MKLLEKGINQRLSLHLKSSEIDCKCTHERCTFTLIAESVIDSFEATRDELGKSIKINSGFRCMIHNESVGGKINSRHARGRALDLSANGHDIERMAMIARRHFDYVQIYYGQNFIHCHNEE